MAQQVRELLFRQSRRSKIRCNSSELQKYPESVVFWTQALNAVPTDNPSADDLKLRSTTEASLKLVKELSVSREKADSM
jgi:hypothetical protein